MEPHRPLFDALVEARFAHMRATPPEDLIPTPTPECVYLTPRALQVLSVEAFGFIDAQTCPNGSLAGFTFMGSRIVQIRGDGIRAFYMSPLKPEL